MSPDKPPAPPSLPPDIVATIRAVCASGTDDDVQRMLMAATVSTGVAMMLLAVPTDDARHVLYMLHDAHPEWFGEDHPERVPARVGTGAPELSPVLATMFRGAAISCSSAVDAFEANDRETLLTHLDALDACTDELRRLLRIEKVNHPEWFEAKS